MLHLVMCMLAYSQTLINCGSNSMKQDNSCLIHFGGNQAMTMHLFTMTTSLNLDVVIECHFMMDTSKRWLSPTSPILITSALDDLAVPVLQPCFSSNLSVAWRALFPMSVETQSLTIPLNNQSKTTFHGHT